MLTKSNDLATGTNSDDGLFMVRDALNDTSLWPDYSGDWEQSGTRALFNIPEESLVQQDDVNKADQALQFYVGSTEDINEGTM